ncbi:hypothetical protein Q8F55_000812 [Vanrija albida]|uniref:Smr domain-containing protein n=1 Tax=Vanrija albida TaxID=181172 RepID=A0ABR3QEB8_9TREE
MAKKKQTKKTPLVSPPPEAPAAAAASETVDPSVLASLLSADFPLIDSSLIHAILLDYDPDTLHNHVDAIRSQLGILEATSVPDTDGPGWEEAPAVWDGVPQEKDASTDASRPQSRIGDWQSHSTDLTTNGSAEEDDDPAADAEMLSALFPDFPKAVILEAINTQPSIEARVDFLLSIELIRGVERSGEWPDQTDHERDSDWDVVGSKSQNGTAAGKKRSPVKAAKAKAKVATRTIPLVDTMQRREGSSRPSSGISTPNPSSAPSIDVWDAFASLASFLAAQVRRGDSAYFLSYLHSPDWYTAYDAVIAALDALARSSAEKPTPEAQFVLDSMFGVGRDDEDRDTQKELWAAIRAADGDAGVAIDLMDLFGTLKQWPDYEAAKEREADPFNTLHALDSALAAVPSRPQTPEPAQATRVQNANRLTRPKAPEPMVKPPPPGWAPPTGVARQFVDSAPRASLDSGTGKKKKIPAKLPVKETNWQTVAAGRKKGPRSAHPLAAHIPAYARGMLPGNNTSGTLKAAELAESRIANGDLSAAECYRRSELEWQRRAEAVRSATQQYRHSGRKDLNAMTKGHYAERAREASDAARNWELRGARLVIENQQNTTPDVIDLHYLTVDQAVTIALEATSSWWARQDRGGPQRPFHIVTGKGIHSAGQRGVLGPAVSNALTAAGWRIHRQSGFISVSGK